MIDGSYPRVTHVVYGDVNEPEFSVNVNEPKFSDNVSDRRSTADVNDRSLGET